jgi:fructokinase
LAFVSLRADGERSFVFFRHPSADMLWRPEDVNEAYVANTRIFHYGSISLIGEPSRSATLLAVECARRAGALISYDPNLRLALWPSADAAREGMLSGLRFANLVKVNEEELEFLTSEPEMSRAARQLWHEDMQLLVVTRGGEGALTSRLMQKGRTGLPGGCGGHHRGRGRIRGRIAVRAPRHGS